MRVETSAKPTTVYCARWVVSVASPPIEDGAVAVTGDRITGVGSRAALRSLFPGARLRDFGEAAILPGLVNCHSHLELTAMRGYLDRHEGDFYAWLRRLTLARQERMTAEDLCVSAMWGATEAARAGVTCLGDASDAAVSSIKALRAVGLRGVVYQESFGPDPRFAKENVDKLRDKLALLREQETGLVKAGVSPHAPYTVSSPQLELIADFALEKSLPLMMHAAESHAEAVFMRAGSGRFAFNLSQRGIEWQCPERSTIQYLADRGVLRTRPLLAHCVTVDETDIRTLREWDTRIAHCPKSNAKLRHGHAPYAAFLQNGMTVGLGSDSVASNNTCDLLEEARFAVLLARAGTDAVRAELDVNAVDALYSATLGGARALGLETEIGALTEGRQADLAVVALSGAHQRPEHDVVSTLVFASSGRDVILTVVAGADVYENGHVQTVDEEHLSARLSEIARQLPA
jgi:cytosine/adenosine deaminase-related metal-dependent hydrolase